MVVEQTISFFSLMFLFFFFVINFYIFTIFFSLVFGNYLQ